MDQSLTEFFTRIETILAEGEKKYGKQFLHSQQSEFIKEKLQRIDGITTRDKKLEDWAKIAAYSYLGYQRSSQSSGIIAVCSLTGVTAKTLQSEGLIDSVIDTTTYGAADKIWEVVVGLKPKHVLLIGCLVVMPQLVITALNNNVYNLHPGTLPGLEGKDPHIKAIEQRRTMTHATIHRVTSKIDSGEILATMSVPISRYDTEDTLYQKLRNIGLKLTRNFIKEVLWQL